MSNINRYKTTSSTPTSTSKGPKARGASVKVGGYCSTKLHARRDKRREEAELRRCVSEGRTRQEKKALIIARRGNSGRELARMALSAIQQAKGC